MTADLTAALVPVICTAALIVGHILAYRSAPALGAPLTLGIGFLGGFLVFLVIQGMVFPSAAPAWNDFGNGMADLAAYLALAYGYFHFVNMGETARRVRILIEMSRFPDGLDREEIHDLYNAREMVDRRLKRLSDAGWIFERNGRLYTGNRAALGMAAVMALFKRLIFPGGSSHD